jgi:Uma2 family endonuclease
LAARGIALAVAEKVGVIENTGFFLPDGSMFSPDAVYIRREKSRRITKEEGGHLLRVVPHFVVELLSPSDTLAKTGRKMETWMSNGAELGWLVNPDIGMVKFSP